MIARYRKKPVIVEALQLVNNNADLFAEWMGYQPIFTDDYGMDIATLEGTMHASYGDWIVKGVRGGHWPVKPDIFELTYEYVELA